MTRARRIDAAGPLRHRAALPWWSRRGRTAVDGARRGRGRLPLFQRPRTTEWLDVAAMRARCLASEGTDRRDRHFLPYGRADRRRSRHRGRGRGTARRLADHRPDGRRVRGRRWSREVVAAPSPWSVPAARRRCISPRWRSGSGRATPAIVPAMTFVATANALRYAGAEVVFADVDPDTGLMGPAHLEAALRRVPSGLTAKAAFPVHLNGQCADLPHSKSVANAHGLRIVEDACHALGATYGDGVKIGAARHADLAMLLVPPGEDHHDGRGRRDHRPRPVPGRSATAPRLRNHGIVRRRGQASCTPNSRTTPPARRTPGTTSWPKLGFNYRASDIACALGKSQFAKLDRFVAAGARWPRCTTRCCAPLDPHSPADRAARPGAMPRAAPLCSTQVDFEALGLARAAVMAALRNAVIGTQVHYVPVPWQPYYRRATARSTCRVPCLLRALPVASTLSGMGLATSIGSSMRSTVATGIG